MNMPVLENQMKRFGKDDNTVVLHINHCMDNSFYFSEKLRELFHEVVFIAVPYNNKDIPDTICPCYHAEQINGAYVLKKNREPVGLADENFLTATCALIHYAFECELVDFVSAGKQIIIIEDGGYHYDVMHRLVITYPELQAAVIGAVEQTTEGTRRSSGNSRYPVLSVARSDYKMRVEAYFIAGTIVETLSAMLRTLDIFLDFRHVYILGYGVVGRSIAMKLAASNVRIHVFDTDEEARAVAESDGFISENEGFVFEDDSVVIGCTGVPAFTKAMLTGFQQSGANRLFLASASSKQVEFSDVSGILEMCEKRQGKYCTSYITEDGKELTLLAEGYPVNFYDKDKESLTYSMIDIVFAEMLLLAQFLKEYRLSLTNETCLLGAGSLADAYVDESGLIALWKSMRNLSCPVEKLNVHPLENRLREITNT